MVFLDQLLATKWVSKIFCNYLCLATNFEALAIKFFFAECVFSCSGIFPIGITKSKTNLDLYHNPHGWTPHPTISSSKFQCYSRYLDAIPIKKWQLNIFNRSKVIIKFCHDNFIKKRKTVDLSSQTSIISCLSAVHLM